MVQRSDASQTRTDWSMILEAVSDESEAASGALDQLARRYWPAVYAFIRSTGCDVHESADLTQGFICDVVIGRKLFHAADPERGRFRSLLLCSLRNYLAETRRRTSRRKASRAGSDLSFISHDQAPVLDDLEQRSPEEVFDAQWTRVLILAVLERVREACMRDGLEPHWAVFERRVARPMLFNEPPLAYEPLIEQLDLRDASQAANMMVTVKRRFARELYDEIARTVRDPVLADGELHHLMSVLEKAR